MNRRSSGLAAATVVVAVIVAVQWWRHEQELAPWTGAEKRVLQSLWLGSLGPLPPDRSNAVADNPDAAAFGRLLFFDTRFSANGAISCATCHQPERRFTDGLPRGVAIGVSGRNTRSIVGAAYSPWQYWDGRRDSLWSQALAPIEDPNEHGSNRVDVVRALAGDADYRERYVALFGAPPDPASEESVDRAFANFGKAIEAYERLLLPGPARFDAYVEAVLAGDVESQGELFSDAEIRGLRLYIGDANCTQCHNGPLFTNHEFHNTGVTAAPGEVPDKGRVAGVREVLQNVFNCKGAYSDDPNRDCPELEFARTGPGLIGAMRTPSLRNLGNTAPFMHKGQVDSLMATLTHYNEAPLAMIGHNEAKPLNLSRRELRNIEAFLLTLDAPLATDARWLSRP